MAATPGGCPVNGSGLSLYWIQPLAALVMGNAVSGMHYMAMAAARFYPGPEMGHTVGEFSNLAMGTTISEFSVLILALTMLATLVDRRIALSEQRHRTEQLRANTIPNTTADGILALDEQGTIRSGNPPAARIFGCSTEQIRGKPITLLIPECQLLKAAELNSELIAESRVKTVGGYREVSGRRADGSVFPLELTMNSMPADHEEITVLSLRDMTERKRAREMIKKAKSVSKSSPGSLRTPSGTGTSSRIRLSVRQASSSGTVRIIDTTSELIALRL